MLSTAQGQLPLFASTCGFGLREIILNLRERRVRIVPQVTVYVRDDDLGAWKAIEKKSEFIHRALGGLPEHIKEKRLEHLTEQLARVETKAVDDIVSISGVVKGSEFVPKPPDPETGYPCCVKARPCKHWQWVGEKEAYVNTLTGKEREADL